MNSVVYFVTPFTSRRLAEKLETRLPELRPAVHRHVTRSNNTHQIDWDYVKALEKEHSDFPGKVLEVIHIRKKGPKLLKQRRRIGS